ncbi:MAG: phosphate acyltransferase, partial [Candidatus Asgardarchaeia archaeon]
EKIIRAAHVVYNDNIAYPILLGNKKIIKSEIEKLGYSQDEFEIIDPDRSEKSGEYAKEFFNLKRIYGIMGGFHMINANKRRIDITISELEKNEISVIYPMHCTGPDAIRALKDKYRKGKVVDSSVGSVIEYK